MGRTLLENDSYRKVKINIVLTSKTSTNHFLFLLKSAKDLGKSDIYKSFTFVTMYIINEDDSEFFIDMYSKIVSFGIDESKILIVHALCEAKFPFIEKYKLNMAYIVKYRDIHLSRLGPNGKAVKFSFDLPDKKMIVGIDALQYLSEKVTSISKKLGNIINKVTVINADYNDLDCLEVLCGSILGNFPLIGCYEFKTEAFNMENLTKLLS
mmetsp:Transcript_25355/g.25090  ORF Transcript_25355/g.25090 Transcript_25355/m.25090 type:complete len:210 (-) Transcript_25355:385-1014(-)